MPREYMRKAAWYTQQSMIWKLDVPWREIGIRIMNIKDACLSISSVKFPKFTESKLFFRHYCLPAFRQQQQQPWMNGSSSGHLSFIDKFSSILKNFLNAQSGRLSYSLLLALSPGEQEWMSLTLSKCYLIEKVQLNGYAFSMVWEFRVKT